LDLIRSGVTKLELKSQRKTEYQKQRRARKKQTSFGVVSDFILIKY